MRPLILIPLLVISFALPFAAAVAQDNPGATYSNGQGAAQAEVIWYRKAAMQGNANAQLNLGVAYALGLGVPQDYAEAMKWDRKAAIQGNAGAQLEIGVMYENGQGVPQDYTEAMKWHLKAAMQGNADAQTRLGVIYANGLGTPQDYQEAYAWLNVAAAQGHQDAAPIRDDVAGKLTPSALLAAQQLSKRYFSDYVKHPSDPAH